MIPIKKWLALVLALSLTGCGQVGIRDDILKWLSTHCSSKPTCSVDLAQFTTFNWEKMYYFREGVRQDTISQVIGTAYPDDDTVTERIVFTARGHITHSEHRVPDLDGEDRGVLVFEGTPAANGFFIVDRANSAVDVRVEHADDRVYYHLMPRG